MLHETQKGNTICLLKWNTLTQLNIPILSALSHKIQGTRTITHTWKCATTPCPLAGQLPPITQTFKTKPRRCWGSCHWRWERSMGSPRSVRVLGRPLLSHAGVTLADIVPCCGETPASRNGTGADEVIPIHCWCWLLLLGDSGPAGPETAAAVCCSGTLYCCCCSLPLEPSTAAAARCH